MATVKSSQTVKHEMSAYCICTIRYRSHGHHSFPFNDDGYHTRVAAIPEQYLLDMIDDYGDRIW